MKTIHERLQALWADTKHLEDTHEQVLRQNTFLEEQFLELLSLAERAVASSSKVFPEELVSHQDMAKRIQLREV